MTEHDPERTTSLFVADAEKTRRLVAAARELGDVAVFHVRTFDPDSPLGIAEQHRQHGLDKLIGPLLPTKGRVSVMFIRLRAGGVNTIRDALVMGRQGVGLEPKYEQIVADTISELYPDEVFLEQPTPADIAGICLTLDQVTAGVLKWYRFELHHGYVPDIHGRLLDFDDQTEFNWTVADVLNDTDHHLEQAMGDRFADCRGEAMQFAAAFLEARHQLDQ